MKKIEILKKLKADFVAEDLAEPFINREYVEETLRIFDLLSDDFTPEETKTDEAIMDIVNDICRYYEDGDDFERLIRTKMKIIQNGKTKV